MIQRRVSAPVDTAPGRHCPLHYRYGPAVFATDAPAGWRDLEVLYVVGGLYGNEPALHEVMRLFERERGRKRLVFNGDFHWFDAEPGVFARVQREVLAFDATRGNVETELADEAAAARRPRDSDKAAGSGEDDDADHVGDHDAGCGCAYPDWVGDAVVERSNRILARLRTATTAAQRRELAALPMWRRADVGPLKLGVVHGDAESLAGWGFAQEHLAEPAHREQARRWLDAARVDAFACTHTCLPVFQRLRGAAGDGWVLNNGAAGMPNFAGDPAGLLTRVALAPFEGPARRFGVRHRGVHLDAIAVEHDPEAFRRQFLRAWPPGSDAHASYFERIERGPDYAPSKCLRGDLTAPPTP